MSTNPYSTSIQYNPIPPRVWSRVQNPCSVIAYKNDDPGANSDFARADYERQMLLKGNILQYKKNSSSLTKKQRYTQIAKGMWINRTKTWATQSDTYTNPNMTSLLRVNSSTVDPSNNVFSSPPNPFGCPTTAIPDGGNLVCNVVVDPCTQEVIKRTKSQQLCNPTTDSDVPGRIQDLCWNDGTQTWYPRQRYIMPTSGTKWPEGYKGFVSALRPAAPVLTLSSINDNSFTLSWTVINSDCIPISSFNIYQNGILISNVLYPTSTIIINITFGENEYNVTSLSNDIESEFSNSILYNSGKYSTTGTTITSGNYSYIYFFTSGTIRFYCPVNLDILVVGGGGGGGGGVGINSGSGGSGGGGGGINNVLNYQVSNTSYNITVGNGGSGGLNSSNGSNGQSSIFDSIMATGGIGGEQNIIDSGYALNTGGLAGGPSSGGNGGNGGNNGGYATNGQNSYGNPIIGNTTFYVGGGGGGATVSNTTPLYSGQSGLNGNGGIYGVYTGINGEDASMSSYGSGGGGGTSTGTGGNGAPGVVILAFLTN